MGDDVALVGRAQTLLGALVAAADAVPLHPTSDRVRRVRRRNLGHAVSRSEADRGRGTPHVTPRRSADNPQPGRARLRMCGGARSARVGGRMTSPPSAVDLYWIPLGAGGRLVRFNGRCSRRSPPLAGTGHDATSTTRSSSSRSTATATRSSWRRRPTAIGSAGGWWRRGPSGAAISAGCPCSATRSVSWRGGTIGDLGEAVGGPRRLSRDPGLARRLLDLVPAVPAARLGADKLHTGEMWNSNSVIAWLIAGAGVATELVAPPAHGRAPGWQAGLAVARRGQFSFSPA